jgi:hypothetical protein
MKPARAAAMRFNMFLADQKTYGHAPLDRMPTENPYKYLKDKI